MSWRRGAIAAVRVANAVFFVTVSAFCFLSYVPFAYLQFIEPNVLPELSDFIVLSPWLFWLVLLVTILTLMPEVRSGRAPWFGRAYVIVWIAVGTWVLIRQPLATLGTGRRALLLGLLALVSPVWLAVYDHLAAEPPAIRPADRFRTLIACALSALAAWATYAVAVPFRLGRAVGIDLSPASLALSLGSSLIADLFVFTALFLALMTVIGVARFARSRATVEYWLIVALLATVITLVLRLLVCASIAFAGATAWIVSIALGATLAALWADVARLRAHAASSGSLDALELFSAPVVGGGARIAALAILAVLPAVAYSLNASVARLDWNFLLQKLGVLAVWLVAFTATYGAMRSHAERRQHVTLLVIAPLLALALYQGLGAIERRAPFDVQLALDRYGVVDPSFRLIREARTTGSGETAEYYAYLRANTLVSPQRIHSPQIDFVKPLPPATGPKPHIFLFVIDSLRRDYVSPYNPQVTFTPELAKFAADSLVFERAFTRYTGTGLAVPSLWAGGMVMHLAQQVDFNGRNALLKLLDANGYLRVMDVDNIVGEFLPPGGNLVRLDSGRTSMQFELCRTLGELQGQLTAAPNAPAFFYALPQNVHIAVASRRQVPAGEDYPGFFGPVASSVRQVDRCFGGFIDFLKRTGTYDNSIIVVTSDHGDSLGEEGRIGHAYFMFPEVMRVPLIVRVPTWLRSGLTADAGAVAFLTDITPALYALLGYEPADLGPLFGRPLFVAPDAGLSWRRRESFLLASSYGAVYAMLRHNGREMYVVDAVGGRDYAFDLSDPSGRRLEITRAMTTVNRELIGQHLMALADLYRYQPSPSWKR